MTNAASTTHDHLQQMIAFQESLRPLLGNALVDAAIHSLRAQLDRLNGATTVEAVPSRPLERKVVTVLFADLSGFTAMSEMLDPEAVRTIISGCFERLVHVIAKYEGTVEKFIGDAVVAIFGAPVAHENDPERAVRAALDMMEEIEQFNRRHNTALGMHAGVNTGPVIAGYIGPPEAHQYAVTGDTVNLAARLEDASKRGQILLGPTTASHVRQRFELKQLPPVSLKGKSRPVTPYEVLRVRIDEPTQAVARQPMVGRQTALQTLLKALHRVAQGTGGWVRVSGPAGIGKSRLLDEARSNFLPLGQDVGWIEGHAQAFGKTLPYAPFVALLRNAAGLSADDDDVIRDKLTAYLAHLFPQAEVDEFLPFLLRLTGHESVDVNRKQFSEAAMHGQIFRMTQRIFMRLTEQPTVLVFDDLNRADESTLRLIIHLMSLCANRPLLLIMLSRPDDRAMANELREATEREGTAQRDHIALTSLSLEEMKRVLKSTPHSIAINPSIERRVLERADGNPYFLIEIIKSLNCSPGTSANVIIPDTLHGVVMARIDQMADHLKDTLKTASVIGSSFLREILLALRDNDPTIEHTLETLMSQDIITRDTTKTETAYAFRYSVEHEVIYESLSLEQRKTTHLRVGEAIESLFSDRLSEWYGPLAHHFARAEAWDKASQYILRAGDEAARVAADAEALNYYRNALSLLSKNDTPLRRARLERKIGEALMRRGELDEAGEFLVAAASRLGVVIPKQRWSMALESLRQVLVQVGHCNLPAPWWRQRQLNQEQFEELIRTLDSLGWVLYFTDSTRFALNVVTSLNVAERLNWPSGIARASSGMGIVCDAVGLNPLAGKYHARAMSLVENLDDAALRGLALMGTGLHLHHLGQLEACCDHLTRGGDAYAEISDLHGWGSCFLLRTLDRLQLGQIDRAAEEIQRALRLASETADQQLSGWARLCNGAWLARQHRHDEAEAECRDAAAILERQRDYSIAAAAHALVGQSRLRRGAHDEAVRDLRAAARAAADRGLQNAFVTHLHVVLADAAAQHVEAAAGAERARRDRLAQADCKRALRGAAHTRALYPSALRVQGTLAWISGRKTQAQDCWQRSLAQAKEMGAVTDVEDTRAELDRWTRA